MKIKYLLKLILIFILTSCKKKDDVLSIISISEVNSVEYTHEVNRYEPIIIKVNHQGNGSCSSKYGYDTKQLGDTLQFTFYQRMEEGPCYMILENFESFIRTNFKDSGKFYLKFMGNENRFLLDSILVK